MENLTIQYKDQQLTFEKDLKLGVEQIDEQHHTLFRLTYAVSQLLDRSPTREEIGVRALELEAYVQEHLGFEETLMSKNGYVDFPAHRQLHEDFSTTARGLIAKISDPSTQDFQQATRELFQILLDWLVDHIMTVDRAASAYLSPGEHGVKPRPPRIKATDDVIVEFADTQSVSGLMKNVSPNSLLVTISSAIPDWLSQDAQVQLHLLPLGLEGNVTCRITRVSAEGDIIAALDQELDINQIAKLIKGTPKD
ncbi:MAG: hemerythrin family protein [Magnetococcales bacterium]|nr:hemerythrin family protein [Magnetococcales bacterium]